MNIRYPFRITPQEPEGFLVECLDMENVSTEGYTLEECLFNASEALTGMLDFYLDIGESIPKPTQGLKDAYYVAPDAKTQDAVIMRLSRGDRSISETAHGEKIAVA